MVAGLPLGRKGLAGRRGKAAASTPAPLVPKRPAAPKGKNRNKRRRKFFDWLCCPCMRGARDAPSSSPYVEREEEEEEDGKEPKKSKNKEKEHEERGENISPKDPHPRRCDLKACLRKLVHERLHRNDKIKMQEEGQRLEEWEDEVHWQGSKQEAIKEEEVAVEEEKVQETGQSGSGSWRLLCFCLFALLLFVATYVSTLHILEETNLTPTREDLKTEMTIAALLVVTAVWSLCAFPSPKCAVSYEVQVLIALIFCNMSLVLVTRAVLAAKTSLGYWCWWVVGFLCPFLLLVLICSLCRTGT